jgi:hypothetical protein
MPTTNKLRSWHMSVGTIPGAAIRGNSRANRWVKAAETKLWRNSGRDHWFIAVRGGVELQKAKITFTFHHDRKIDADNLAIGCKPFIDGLVDMGMVPDDDPDHVTYGEHQFVICKRGESKTEVLIEEVQ